MLCRQITVVARFHAQQHAIAIRRSTRRMMVRPAAFIYRHAVSTNPNLSIRACCVRAYVRLIARYNFPRYERVCAIIFFLTRSREHYRLQSYSSLQYK